MKSKSMFLNRELLIIKKQIKSLIESDLMVKASSLAFSTLLSLIPMLAVAFMIFNAFIDEKTVDETLKNYLYNFLSPVGTKEITKYINDFLESATIETLGLMGVVSLLVTVYFILSSIEKTINEIWKIKKTRKFLGKVRSYWFLMSILPILIFFSLTITTYISNQNDFFIKDYIFAEIAQFISVYVFFNILIIVSPNCKVRIINSLLGCFIGACLYYISKNIFVYYSKLAVSYSVIYGSIAVLPLFMIWIYIFWIIILFTVENTFIRQNIDVLNSLDKSIKLNFHDQFRVSLIIFKKLVKDYLTSKDLAKTHEYSKELEIPLIIVNQCFKDFKDYGLVKYSKFDEKVLYPNIPIENITVGKVLESLYKSNLPDRFINSEIEQFIKEINFKNNTKIKDLI